MKKFLILISVIFLSSCAGVTYISTPQTVALNQGNFKMVKTATASATAYYVLGIGGFSEEANADVVEKLIEEARLQPNQALADIRVKTTCKCYLGVVVVRTLTASATVVEFTDSVTGVFLSRDVVSDDSLDQTERETKLKRLLEISTALSGGSVNDVETIRSEVAIIERWYNENGFYKPIEWNELKKVKDLLSQGD